MNQEIVGTVHTDQQNEIFELLEKFGNHQSQYAVLVATLIALSKATGENLPQVLSDISANWPRVGSPDVIVEH